MAVLNCYFSIYLTIWIIYKFASTIYELKTPSNLTGIHYVNLQLQYMKPYRQCMKPGIHINNDETGLAMYKLIFSIYDSSSSIYGTKVAMYGMRYPYMKPNFQYINSFFQYM
jgi:hypothetical protein